MRGLRVAISVLMLGGMALNASSATLRVEVKPTGSGPMLLINGKPAAPTLFFVNFKSDPTNEPIWIDEIATAAKHGVNLLTIPIYMPWKQEGVETSFAETDRIIDTVLKANPKALIVPRFGVCWPPQWWVEKHPEEIMLYDDGKRQTASVHSRIWRKAAAENVTALVKRLEGKYGDHMLGYHPTGQHTGEWFFDRLWEGRLGGFESPALHAFRAYLKDKYRTDAALRRAWHSPGITFERVELPTLKERTQCKAGQFRDPLIEQNTIDFFEFQNLDMATAVEDMCKAVKAGAPNKITVMFYGYPFELSTLPFGPQTGGHLAMWYLLKSPYLDVMCSPLSYQNRLAGGGGYFMTAVDSVQRHGKLWLVEDDTRTHLGQQDQLYKTEHTRDMRETQGVLARNFGHILTRGSGVWWMDLFGVGWFQGDELWSFLAKLQSTYQDALLRLKPYRAEIAVILDERSCLHMEPGRNVTGLLLGAFREHWYRIGAPVGIYLLDDLVAGKVPPAKMYVILNAFRLDRSQIDAIRKNAFRKGCTVIWMYAPGIVRDGVLNPDNVRHAVGMRLAQTEKATGEIVIEATGEEFSAGHGKLSPMFEVADKDARPIARYLEGGVAVAVKKVDGMTSVYAGVLQLPSSLLRDLARRAGVHIYSDENDLIMAGNEFVGIHASSEGRKTIRIPTMCNLVDTVTGESFSTARSFPFDMKLGDTRLLKIAR